MANHNYLIEVFWDEESQCYICIAPDLPGCSSAGDTPQQAIAEMNDAIGAWLEGCIAMNRAVPKPVTLPRKAA